MNDLQFLFIFIIVIAVMVAIPIVVERYPRWSKTKRERVAKKIDEIILVFFVFFLIGAMLISKMISIS